MIRKILVWDAPTRLFHWLFAASFAGAFLTSESERYRDMHILFGYTFLGLIAFRLAWGVMGSRYARFGSFAFGPARLFAYVKSLLSVNPMHFVGHNPVGGWAVFALLALGALTGASGYAVYGELGGDGLEELHEGAANAMLALVVVHILGVMASSVLHRENLPWAMLTGYKTGAAAEGIRRTYWSVGFGLLFAVAALWAGLF
ncbi:MAG: cytochrome b/b6 domain-containing protein [Gammaproteobacteria bacterium]